MARFVAFIIRLVGYAVVLGMCGRAAQYLWERNALDQIADLQQSHDMGMTILAVAPLVLAIVGAVVPRIALFALFFLAGAALTAPFAFGRLVH